MTGVIVALALSLIVMAYGLRKLVYERRALQAHRVQIAEELHATRAAYKAMYDELDPLNGYGGVFKRIDEIREITEAVRDHRPELFLQAPGLIHWLEASDRFLCRLRDTAMPQGSTQQHDEQRVFWHATGRTSHIYEDVRVKIIQKNRIN